jgi:hypothetical protein
MSKKSLSTYGFGGGVTEPGKPTAKDIKKKYGKNPFIKDREFWGEYLDADLPSKKKVRDVVYNAAKQAGVNPAILYTSAMEEGMQLYKTHPDDASEAYVNWQTDNRDLANKFPVDGFYNYGLDRFGEEADRLIKLGYLKPEYKDRFTSYDALNEKKEKIKTAAFASDEDALVAKAAMMRDAEDRLNHYAKQKKYNLSDKGKEFFTLAAYNGGLGTAQKMLDSWNQKGYLKDDKYLDTTFKPASYAGVYENVQKRVQNKNVLETEGFFSDFAKMDTGGEAGADESTDWKQMTQLGGAGIQVADTILGLLEGNASAQSKEPLVNISTVRTMTNPYKKFAVGGEAGDALEQLQAMADEQGISIEELIAMLQGGGEEEIMMEEEAEMEEFAVGGITGQVPINAEGGEVIETPDGQVGKIKGKKHEQGGVNMVVPKGTKVYSDRVEIGGRTMQERKIDREKINSRLDKLLSKNPNDNILKNTAKRTAEINAQEEAEDMQVQKTLQALTSDVQKMAAGGYVDGEDPTWLGKQTKKFLNPPVSLAPVTDANPLIDFLSGTSDRSDNYEHYSLNSLNRNIQDTSDLDDTIEPTQEVGGRNIIGTSPRPNIPETATPSYTNQQFNKALAKGSVEDEEEEENVIGLTTGDYIGLAGNLFNANATKPNINRWKGFGKDAINANDVAQDLAAGTLANKKTDIDTSAATAKARNRNSARSVNTVRALDAITDMGVNKARGGAEDSFAGTMIGLLGQRGQLENMQDQAEMGGQERADIADKQDTDNYYSQMAENLTNFGSNIQGIGKSLNVNKSNNVNARLISQLSKYGLTMDEDGNLISTK